MANPLCTYFGECGGCSCQHIDYSVQLENKKKALARAINFDNITVFSGKEYGYRNRMDFVFTKSGIGLRKKDKWHNIIDIEKCAISNEKLNTLLKETRDFFKEPDYFDLKRGTGTFKYAVIRTPREDSSISFVLSESGKLSEAIEQAKEFAAKTTANNILVTYVPKETDESVSDEFFAVKGNDMLKEKYLGIEFLYSVQGFFQNNQEIAEKMHQYVHELLKSHNTKDAHLLDLYAGVGTFGIINAKLFKNVTIIENSKQCIDAANLNITNNNIQNAKALVLDAKQLKKVQLPQPLFVITDPPRSGMEPKTIQQLNELRPAAIIYISCNIQQLAKDIQKFSNYSVKSAAMFDLFPQTNHIEAVVELARIPKNL